MSHHESELVKLEVHFRETVQGLEREVQKLRMQDEARNLTPRKDDLNAAPMLNEKFQSLDWQMKSLKDQYEADMQSMRYQN
jgi:hypothetical protein